MGVLVLVPMVLNFIGLGGATEMVIKIARWPALLIVVSLALAVLYRYGPSREKPQWRWITWGSAVAAVSWLVVSILFSWYAENFGNYNKTYGSLGAVIAFMFWIWLSISEGEPSMRTWAKLGEMPVRARNGSGSM